jgi:hypothetical protein
MIIIIIIPCDIFTHASSKLSQTGVGFDPMSFYALAHHTNPQAKLNCILLLADRHILREYNNNNIGSVRKEVCIVYLLWRGVCVVVST